jgi:hypothetical protein
MSAIASIEEINSPAAARVAGIASKNFETEKCSIPLQIPSVRIF